MCDINFSLNLLLKNVYVITKVGEYDHLESGSVIIHANEKVFITIQGFSFEFIFVDNPAIKETKVEASGGGLNLILTFLNFTLGAGHINTQILPVGTINSRKLYLNYAVHGFGTITKSVGKLVHYTFMLGENV